MNKKSILIPLLLACAALGVFRAQAAERLSLDAGWRFLQGDVALPSIQGHGASYLSAQTGEAHGPAKADYDDSTWRRLDLPHDWAVEGPYGAEQNKSQGYRPRGIGWYRRYFTLPVSDRGRHLELQLDAVATHSTVWVNGIVVNRNWLGYNGRALDITPYVRYGDEVNTIAVRADANAMEGWWYEGAGIYRHTWLVKRSSLHLITDGVFANPTMSPDGAWSIPVEATVANSGSAAETVGIIVELLDGAGHEIARGMTTATVEPLQEIVA